MMPFEVITDAATGTVVVREYAVTAEDLAAALTSWRANAKCSPMQGKLALGQDAWAKIEAYRDLEATWAEKIVIDSAQEWQRNSQDIQFFAYLLNYNDEQIDALFTAAMQIAR